MIFDFRRCFFETDKWEFVGYWEDNTKENEKHYFSELRLYMPGKKISFKFYDDVIDEFEKRLSAAIRSEKKVMCWEKDFKEENEDLQMSVDVKGWVNTYEQN